MRAPPASRPRQPVRMTEKWLRRSRGAKRPRGASSPRADRVDRDQKSAATPRWRKAHTDRPYRECVQICGSRTRMVFSNCAKNSQFRGFCENTGASSSRLLSVCDLRASSCFFRTSGPRGSAYDFSRDISSKSWIRMRPNSWRRSIARAVTNFLSARDWHLDCCTPGNSRSEQASPNGSATTSKPKKRRSQTTCEASAAHNATAFFTPSFGRLPRARHPKSRFSSRQPGLIGCIGT
jgi:hypothetical protein